MSFVLIHGCAADAGPDAGALLDGPRAKLGPAPAQVGFHASGVLNPAAELQGSRPGAQDESLFQETLALTPRGGVVHEMDSDRIDGTGEWIREVYQADSKTIHIMEDSFSVRLTDHPEVSGQHGLRRRFPRALLEEASSSAVLTQISPSDLSSNTVVRAVFEDNASIDLTFGPDSLLYQAAYSSVFPISGETRVTWHFSDYQMVEGGLFPHRYEVTVGDLTFAAMSVDWVTTDGARIAALAEPPAGFPEPRPINQLLGPDGNAEVERLADGVYRVRSLRPGFNPAFVEFEDFVAVVDAPAGYPLLLELPAGDVAPGPTPDWLGQRFHDLVRETVGEKPVRHAILTHLHGDHAGGLRTFLAPGVTVYASPGDTAAIRAFMDAPIESGAELTAVTQGTRITDGSRSLDVIQIGPNPHTHEMLVALLQDPAFLFVNDLVPGASAEHLMGPQLTPTQAFFRSWLARTSIDQGRLVTIHATETVDLAALQPR